MKPGIYKIEDQLRGDTFNGVEYTIRDYDTSEPINLTGATIKCQFRKGSKTGLIQVDLSIGTGLTVTDTVNGIVEIDSISRLDWVAGVYYYDVEVTLASGDRKTYIEGTFKIIEDTTK